jgi:hypothetical protein
MADVSRVTDLSRFQLSLAAVGGPPIPFRFEAGPEWREAAARRLAIVALGRFTGEGEARSWFDGVEVEARFEAQVVQTCGVSLETFASELSGTFQIRLVPDTSPYRADPAREVEIDPDGEDPPDLLHGERVDVGELLFEHLALEIDPFPRKPGAVFQAPDPPAPVSPFAVLKRPV